MSLNILLVQAAGRVTRDPESKTVSGDKLVTTFSIAINRKYRDKEEVTFLDCEAWGRTAEFVGQYVLKGSAIFVSGTGKTESWEKDGQTRTKFKVTADVVQFTEGKKQDGDGGERPAPAQRAQATRSAPSRPAPDEDSPPF